MGAALQATGRNITYSCSWPAYLGNNETLKPFQAIIDAGCNSWRNWDDVQCSWKSMSGIIDHWGDYGHILVPTAGPGHWHDMDMLLIGSKCLTTEEERTQMAIWSISASPLIMGNDLRNVSLTSKEILCNQHAIAVSQDAMGKMGTRLKQCNASSPEQVWFRPLSNGDVAVALYNKGGSGSAQDSSSAKDITVHFQDIGLQGYALVFDIWLQKSLGRFKDSYTARKVAHHDSAFLRLSPLPEVVIFT